MQRKWKRRSRKLAREMYWWKHNRATYECPDCGRTEDELLSTFEVHHKDGEPLNNNPENHVALCRPCHNLREGKKPSLEAIRHLRDSLAGDSRSDSPVGGSDNGSDDMAVCGDDGEDVWELLQLDENDPDITTRSESVFY